MFKNLLSSRFYFMLLTVGLIFLSPEVYGQNVKSIIKKHLKAIGGLKKINSEQNIHATGAMDNPMTGSVKMEMYSVNNMGFRMSMTKNDTVRTTVLYNKYRWTETTPGKKSKAQKMPDAAWESFDLDLAGEIADYEKKGNTAEYITKENVAGTECYKIKLTRKSGKTTYYFIDVKTYYIIQSTVFIVKDGKEVDQGTSRFGDYKKTAFGLTKPFLLMQVVNGTVVSTTKLDTIEINSPVNSKMFEIPQN